MFLHTVFSPTKETNISTYFFTSRRLNVLFYTAFCSSFLTASLDLALGLESVGAEDRQVANSGATQGEVAKVLSNGRGNFKACT